jgi:hypothetical protein
MQRLTLSSLRRLAENGVRHLLEPFGYQLSRRGYYSPIPVVEELPSGLWDAPAALPGLDLRVDDAVALLVGPLEPYFAEFNPPLDPGRPGEFWLRNDNYSYVDASTLYAMLRHLKPSRVYELGSGFSSHVIQMAAAANARDARPLEHTIFDPFPYEAGGTLGPVRGATVHATRTEKLHPAQLASLSDGDVLFVDTTHTVRTGGDVTRIFLDIVPNLASGVTVHVHDIFLPYEYPRHWVVDRRFAWAEQYLLQAFLAFNRDFAVTLPNYAVLRASPNTFRALVPSLDEDRPGAGGFWFQRSR